MPVSNTENPKTIFCLTYHEITADARVLKEARALQSAGHNVQVFCDWPEGFSQVACIDGIQVKRFNWQSPEFISAKTLDPFFFVDRISEEVNRRFVPYMRSADLLNKSKSWAERIVTPEQVQVLDPNYYKHFEGTERRRRKIRHKSLYYKTLLKHGFGHNSKKLKTLMSGERELKKRRRELYQLCSLIFANNLLNLKFDEAPDVIHAHDIYCLPAGVVLAKHYNAKLVYDAHEYEPARATNNPSDGSNFAEKLEDDCLAYVDHMITVSPSFADFYSKRFKSSPTLIFNAPEIDPNFIKKRKAEALDQLSVRAKSHVSDDTPLVVFTGGIQMSHRGMDKVLEALVYLPKVHLATMGPRHKENDAWFLKIARDLGISQRVTLLPPVAAPDVPVAISTADLAICPFQDVSKNHRYAMPNKLFEAAFAGIPICLSDLPEMRRFAEELGFGRTMDQTDPKCIAQAIEDVLDHPESYRMTPENADNLWTNYSWPAQVAKLIALYDDI
ncbi:glycosyltransferase [Ruegeria arenilitoris]|uniref:glycosyltransferase n=1 Tax=Ruegeria arenilitoris TaxID=1173585 RepID=UPI00147B1B43|nr:glycosyltransferase [Ruegeria arenilitoris]